MNNRNDLISRTAAIEAFDDKHFDRNYGDVSPESVIRVIESIPVVDAISVKWLEDKFNTLCFEAIGAGALYGDQIGELTKSINEVIKLWQKEREART